MVTFDTGNYPEEEQLKFGKANADKFVKYDMSIITVDDKDTANKVISRISKGQITFEDAIAEYSDKNYSDSDGKLTNNSQYQIENILKDKENLSTVIGLAQDETSAAIETLMGFSIFKNNGNATQPDFANEDTLKDVKNYISIYETSIIEDYFADIAKNFIKDAKASDIDSAAANYDNAVVEDLAAFPLNYGSSPIFEKMDTSTVKVLTTADKNEDFLKQAFSLKLNDYSDPIIIGGDIVVLKYVETPVVAETTEESDETAEAEEIAEEAAPSDYSSQLVQFDQATTQDVVFQSPKLENNFISVYFDNFMNTSN